jgi:hypothetical protein
MIKIIVIAEVPDNLGQAWFQHVQDFNVKHPGCHFNAFADAPDKSADEIMEILNVKPPLAKMKVTKQ